MLQGSNKNLGDIRPGDSVHEGQGIFMLAYLDRSCTGASVRKETCPNNRVGQVTPPKFILCTSAPEQGVPLNQIQEGSRERRLRDANGRHVEEATKETGLLPCSQSTLNPIVV